MQRQPIMTTLFLCAAAASALPAHARQAQDASLPKAEVLLDKHVEATGGKDAHLAIETRKKAGKLAVDMAGHKFEAKIEQHFRGSRQESPPD